MTKQERADYVGKELAKLYPETPVPLDHTDAFTLLVAVVLSAQCTDKKVNEVTPKLFARYPTLDDYLLADPREFEQLIFQTGFYRNKTRHILAAAQVVKHQFHGVVPRTMEEMLMIPGVARKTANVVLGNAYGVVEGIAVDTHVKRFARRFGLSDEEEHVRIEHDLMEVLPREQWFRVTYLMIEFGRTYCPARMHDHATHPLGKFVVRE